MNTTSLKDRGRNLGLDPCIIEGSEKILIRSLQKADGHEPCFLTEKRTTCKDRCDYRNKCRRLTAAWQW